MNYTKNSKRITISPPPKVDIEVVFVRAKEQSYKEVQEKVSDKRFLAGSVGAVLGGLIGFFTGGPVGAVIGVAIGGGTGPWVIKPKYEKKKVLDDEMYMTNLKQNFTALIDSAKVAGEEMLKGFINIYREAFEKRLRDLIEERENYLKTLNSKKMKNEEIISNIVELDVKKKQSEEALKKIEPILEGDLK